MIIGQTCRFAHNICRNALTAGETYIILQGNHRGLPLLFLAASCLFCLLMPFASLTHSDTLRSLKYFAFGLDRRGDDNLG